MKSILSVSWKQLLAEGLFFVLLGLSAIILPGLFTLSLELIIGFLFLFGGVVQGVRAIKDFQSEGAGASLFSSILSIIIGALLLFYPLTGAVTLTILLAFYFLFDGISRIVWAWPKKANGNWWWVVISGVLSIILAFLIWNQLPESAIWVIGLLVGINLLFFGSALIAVSLNLRSIAK